VFILNQYSENIESFVDLPDGLLHDGLGGFCEALFLEGDLVKNVTLFLYLLAVDVGHQELAHEVPDDGLVVVLEPDDVLHGVGDLLLADAGHHERLALGGCH
jgi:hypothetical protein